MSDEKKVGHVYAAIVQVSKALSRDGIGKKRVAEAGAGGRYQFRGIDDIYNAIASPLYEADLVIIPRVLERTVSERTNAKGTVMTYAVLTVEFDIVSAKDGSVHTARTMGEAMDSSDKATNKAMSAAYKYMAFQVFCIPTEGEGDVENHSHEKSPSDSGRDLTAPLAASTRDWKTYESRHMSALRNAAKGGKGALQEEWANVFEDMKRSNVPAEVRKAITDAKDDLKAVANGAAHP